MSTECIRERICTNRKIHGSGEQWKLSNSNCSDRITTTGSRSNRISKRTNCIKYMSTECIRERICTNRKIHGRGEQWKLSNSDRSDRITTSTWNSISDGTCSIKYMSTECIRERICTNRKINCRGEQWKLSNSNCSDRITTSTWNSISDGTCSIKYMSTECIRERICTNRKIHGRGEQWKLSNSDRS